MNVCRQGLQAFPHCRDWMFCASCLAFQQVFGVVVRSRGLGGNIMAGLRSLAGGEIIEYTKLLEDARRHAIDRMVQNATAMGANAAIRMQFDSSEIGTTISEIVAYGTAVCV